MPVTRLFRFGFKANLNDSQLQSLRDTTGMEISNLESAWNDVPGKGQLPDNGEIHLYRDREAGKWVIVGFTRDIGQLKWDQIRLITDKIRAILPEIAPNWETISLHKNLANT